MSVPGTLIEGKYEILGKIREGGMGAIYKVRHRLLDEIRVIKVMQPQIGDSEEMKKRFVQEAKTVTKLKHTNIGTVLDFALDANGTAYIVMEFIDGVTLADVFKTAGPPEIPLALEVAHQTLLALGYLHRRNVVHRDIAPDNLMLTRDEDGNPRVKVIDLGIAKALDKTVEITSTGVFLGKVKYCSPEQLGGLPKGETLDGRSDIYSLGVVLYEMLTGHRPFPGETPRELFAAHLFTPPIPFAESDPTGRVPEPVRAAVLKALEKKREDRFASADEFDREILRLKPQVGDVDHSDATTRMILSARATPLTPVASVTPSAQDRLDHQFRAQSTPAPITAGLSAVPIIARPSSTSNDIDVTVGATAPPPPPTGPRAAVPGDAAPSTRVVSPAAVARPAKPRSSFALAALVIVLVLAAAGTLYVRSRRTPSSPGAGAALPQPAGAARDVPPPPAAATEAPSAEPTAVPAPTAEPTAAPPVPAPAPAAAAESRALRSQAEEARGRAARSRAAAERARAGELAKVSFEQARAKEREAQRLLDQGNPAAAKMAFELAAQLFESSEMAASNAAALKSRREAEASAALQPSPIREPEPVRPTAVAAEPTRAPATAVPPRVPTEAERIAETLRAYEKAQSTLDVDLYARVYAGLTDERRQQVFQAWQGLKSQEVKLECQPAKIAGASADVTCFERRLAVPKVGTEQRNDTSRGLHLEKRGDAWVITGMK